MGILLSKGSTAEVTFSSPQQIIISHTDDSIRIGDGTDLVDVTSANALKVDGSAVTQPISGTVTVTPSGTQDVNVVSSVEVEVKNDTGNPVPVSGTVAATQSGTWNINNVSGTVSLPTGAATAANQATEIASLASIDAGIPAGLGAATAANSMPVTLSTDGYPFVRLPDGGSQAIPSATELTQSFSGVGFGTWLNTNGASTMTAHGTGTWSALIAVYGSNDGGTTFQFLPQYAYTNGSQQTFLQTDNSPSQINIGGWRQVALRCAVYTSGAPIAIKYWLNAGQGPTFVMSQLAATLKAQAHLFDGAGTAVNKGQTTLSGSLPVAIASDQTAIPVTDNGGTLTVDGTVSAAQSGTWNINNISGTVSLPTGAATETTLGDVKTAVQLIDDTVATTASAITTKGIAVSGTDGTNARILKTDTSGELQVDVLTLPANASVNIAQIAATTTAVSTGSTSAGTQRVISASGATGTLSNVSASASSVQLLAANTARLGVIIYNDSNANLYVKFGTTASATDFSVYIPRNSGYEMWVSCYNGRLDGIWSGATGTARITEIT